jgi:hypothetical protein
MELSTAIKYPELALDQFLETGYLGETCTWYFASVFLFNVFKHIFLTAT